MRTEPEQRNLAGQKAAADASRMLADAMARRDEQKPEAVKIRMACALYELIEADAKANGVSVKRYCFEAVIARLGKANWKGSQASTCDPAAI